MLISIFLPVILLATTQIGAHAQNEDIVFATYTYSTNDRLQNLEPLAEHLPAACSAPMMRFES